PAPPARRRLRRECSKLISCLSFHHRQVLPVLQIEAYLPRPGCSGHLEIRLDWPARHIEEEQVRLSGIVPGKRAGDRGDDSLPAANPTLVQLDWRDRKHVID